MIIFLCVIMLTGILPVVSPSNSREYPNEEQTGRTYLQLPDSMIEYLIITPEDFASAYVPLAEWKTQKGVPAKIVTLEDIDAAYDLQPDIGAEVQQFLKDFNDNNNYTLVWVLLGADHEWIPARSMYTEASQTLTYGDDFYPSDFYYAGLNSTWDTNEDGVFGEVNDTKGPLYEVDYNAKAFVGRLPADNVGQVQNYVNGLLQYEQSPLMDGWLGEALLADAVFDPPNIIDDYFTPSVDEGYGEWEDNGLEATNLVKYRLKDDFEFKHLYDYDQIPGGNYSPEKDILDQDTFVEAVNDGYGIVNVVSHSFLSGNGTVSYEGPGNTEVWRRFFYYTDAASMSNGVKRSFMYFSDCDVLNFTETDDSNFETLLTNPTGGAVAVVGPTGSTYRGESDASISRGNWWIADRFWYLFSQGHIRPGENLYRTKYDYYLFMIDDLNIPRDWPSLNTNMVSYNVLGDPEVPIWPGQPKYMEVQVPKVYVDSDTIWITVLENTTKAPLQGAKICIMGSDGTYMRGTTDPNGEISFASSFTQPSVLDLTVTMDGYIPYIDDLRIRPEPTDLAVASDEDIGFEFPTDPPVAGMNGNISVFVSNLGTTTPEENFKVNFTDSYSYFGVDYIDNIGEMEITNIPASTRTELIIPWKPNRPGNHIIRIKVDAYNDVEEYNEANNVITKSKTVSGPDLKISTGDIDIIPGQGVSQGDTVIINATVTNVDWGQVSGFDISFYDGNPDAGGSLISEESYQTMLNINEKVTIGVETQPLTDGGMHEYYVEVDPSNTIVESNELNNRAFTTFYVNHLPGLIDVGTITVLEDDAVTSYIDLLDANIASDEDNTTNDLRIEVINISNPACGFTLRDGRYVDISPQKDWFGKATVNISLTDGIAVIYTEIKIDIIPVNDPPVIDSIALGTDKLKIGEELVVYIDITDIDSEVLNVQVVSTLFPGQTFKLDVRYGTPLETGVMLWDGAGNVTFKNRPVGVETLSHSLTVTVFDDLAFDQETKDITISEEQDTDDEDGEFLGLDSTAAVTIIIVIILLVVVILLLLLGSIMRRRAYESGPKLADIDEEESESEEESENGGEEESESGGEEESESGGEEESESGGEEESESGGEEESESKEGSGEESEDEGESEGEGSDTEDELDEGSKERGELEEETEDIDGEPETEPD